MLSTKERRERQKLAMKEAILAAARQVAREEGWPAVTVRRVAALVEYTPPIIYQYFMSKEAMLEELQAQGFALLAEGMRRASTTGTGPRERLLAVADAYLAFAYEQPEIYQLMHGSNSASVALEATLPRATVVAEIVRECLEAWAAAHHVALPDPETAVEIAWGLIHGLISVEMLGRLRGGKERVREMVREAIGDLLTAWALKWTVQ